MIDSTKLPEIDINAIVTDLNNKADRDLVNSTVPYVVSRTANSYGGVVEIWSDGYCVQTGIVTSFTDTTITLEQSYVDKFYNVQLTGYSSSTSSAVVWICRNQTANSFIATYYRVNSDQANNGCYWRAEGYIK